MIPTVMVTGAGGLVGSHAVRAIYEKHYRVIALHRKLGQGDPNVPWHVLQVDLLDRNTPRRLRSVQLDLIVHCAAVLPTQFWGEEAERAAQANLVLDERIVSLCLNRGCPLVYASSASVYGAGNGSIATEQADLSPMGPYAAAKVESERNMLTELPGKAIILRISSPYGPGQRRRTVLRLFIERALANLDLVYHGTGKREQDFVSASDVGNAILCAVTHMNAAGIFNIASGNTISMRDLAELIVRTIPGTRSKVTPSGQPDPQENYRAAFSIAKARAILGWSPSVSLENGIRIWAQHIRETGQAKEPDVAGNAS